MRKEKNRMVIMTDYDVTDETITADVIIRITTCPMSEELEDITGVIIIRISKKKRTKNDQQIIHIQLKFD